MGERWLCYLWRRQRWNDVLATAGGQSLQVIYPGRHTFDHGPDFRDALLSMDDDLVRGDVEVHVRTADWRSHGHQTDPYYDRVVLHVVWRDDGPSARTSTGRPVPLLAMEHLVDEKVGQTAEDEMGHNMPCYLERGSRSIEEATHLIRTMGEARLRDKATVFEAALATEPAQALYAALLDALGYSANRMPCRALASNLPWDVLVAAASGLSPIMRESELETLLLGAAGLLPSQRPLKRALLGEDASYATELSCRWQEANSLWRVTPLPQGSWQFARVRPDNFPQRRLAAAAHLLAPFVKADLAQVFLGIFWSEDPADVPRALEEVLLGPPEALASPSSYWSCHHDFGSKAMPPSHLIGRARAAEIAVNVLIPYAIAWGDAHDDPMLSDRAWAAYRQYPPLGENELSRYVARLVFGHRRPKGLKASEQQGLLHVYHRFCREKRCPECPLGADSQDASQSVL